MAAPVKQLSSCHQLSDKVHLARCDVHRVQTDAIWMLHLQPEISRSCNSTDSVSLTSQHNVLHNMLEANTEHGLCAAVLVHGLSR